MAIGLAPDWGQHFHDDNGGPASGWFVYTFASHTETYKQAWSDPGGATLHSPAIELDARGEYPGQGLFLTIGEAYTLELRNPMGGVVRTVHNVIIAAIGPKGDTGEKGDTGDTGPAGADGIDGVAGGIGPRGLQGDKGDTGEAGPAGVKGDQGIQGIKGDKGDTGDQGIKGDTGDTGATGAAGANGANVVHRLWSPVSGLTVSVTAFGTQVDLNNVTWTNSGSSNMINLIFSNVASGLKLNTINVYADTSVYTTADNFFECFWPEPFGGTTLPTSTIPTLTWYNSLGQVQSPTGWVWSHVSSGSQIVLFHVPGPNKAFYFRVGVL